MDDDTFGFRAVLPDAGGRVLTDGDVTLTEGVAGAVLRNGDVVPAGGTFGGVAVSVVLTAALRAESYSVSIGGNGQLETQPAELVFDGGAPWSVAQTMLVRALDDEALDGDVVATLLGVNVTVVDNEVQAIVLDGLDSVVVDEDAGAIALPLSTRFPLAVGESVAVVATLGGQSVSGMAPGGVRLPMTGNSIDDGDRNVTLLVTPTQTLAMPIEPLRVDVLVMDNDVPSIFDPNSNDVLLTSEDGTSATFFRRGETFGVCSRNCLLKRPAWARVDGVEYAEGEVDENKAENDGGDVYWDIASRLDIEAKLAALDDDMCIQGEIVGPRIQSNYYGFVRTAFFMFSAYTVADKRRLTHDELQARGERLGILRMRGQWAEEQQGNEK